MRGSPTIDEILAVISLVSAGDKTSRVPIPAQPDPDEPANKLALALNVLLGHLAARAESSDAAREFSQATMEPEWLVTAVARRLAEAVGDQCVVLLTSEDGRELVPMAVHGGEEEPEHLLREMRGAPLLLPEHAGLRIAHETGEPLVVAKTDLGAPEWAGSKAAHSLLIVPLRTKGSSFGLLLLTRYRWESDSFGSHDVSLACALADHASLALANSRSYTAERVARAAAERAMRTLSEAEGRFARLSEAGIIGVLVTDPYGRVKEANPALLGLIGYSREELLSGSVDWRERTPPEWREADERALSQLFRTGTAPLREKVYVRKDGNRVPVLVGSAKLEGEPALFISFVLDLTERNEARAAIERMARERAADARFRSLLEAAPDAMVIAREDGTIVLVNAQTERLFGYSREELLGQPIDMLVPERFRSKGRWLRTSSVGDANASKEGSVLDVYGLRKDGTELPIEVNLSPISTEDGLLLSSSIRDLTERKLGEQERASLAALVDSSDEAIIGKTVLGVVTSWNLGARRIFGYEKEEIVGKPVGLLIPPDRAGEERVILETARRGEVKRFDTVRRNKSGEDIDVSVTISPIRDAAGRVVAISKVARDITDRRRAEDALARAKDAAEAATRELEAFSYSVAHDLRAPLRGMSGFARMLRDTYKDALDLEGQDWLDEIVLNAAKMGDLIDALLSLARVTRSELSLKQVDLSEIVREVALRLRASAGRERSVTLEVEDNLVVEMDVRLARALVENLLGNAWKFTEKTRNAKIAFGADGTGVERTFFVRDNGAGFDMAFAGKLFGPFQRLHTTEEFPGTGIGLATVQRIVHRHGGRVWAEGAIHRGATFFFTVPSRDAGGTP